MPTLARIVFACFKRFERLADRVTGAAGPYFIGLAVILFTAGTFSFVDVVLPNLPWPLLTVPPCLLIIVNLFAHYYYVCTVPPGFAADPPSQGARGILWAHRPTSPQRPLTGVQWSSNLHITPGSTTKCTKCGVTKPERTHHCRICNRCVLKYDHHCPVSFLVSICAPIPFKPPTFRINQCVGLHNERHFVLFMAYVVIDTFWYVALGWPHILLALGINYQEEWNHHVSPIVFAITYILSIVMCLSVGVLLVWHLWSVACGETSVENSDHDVYRRVAKSRGDTFLNSYDLGRKKNLQLFFNVGHDAYPYYTLLLPLRVPPYTDGRSWARRPGYDRHHGVRVGEELTDEEDEE
ncbi:zf-DHHC-domain-containing protein [Artomyces pyxidatus]|uniref:Zf-DHHC-domain-containing protein n=1 Tax=Artomyces pyxidatus TaxID=48021 RepID=A0ACB8SMY2_9AGAM|nr:zf-DHHC-domain-containing protein [Artomyces pyxidatus]